MIPNISGAVRDMRFGALWARCDVSCVPAASTEQDGLHYQGDRSANLLPDRLIVDDRIRLCV